MQLSNDLYLKAFYSIPSGLILLNSKHEILAWNNWLHEKTGLSEEVVMGKKLPMLFPEKNFDRFHYALEQIFSFGAPQILSQTLNHYLIPVVLEKYVYVQLEAMQQHVEILPIKDGNDWLALVVIEDVTDNVHQRNILMQLGKKFEEETYHDSLTNIYNRRFLWGYLDKLMMWSKRELSFIGCILMDLDYFKRINDEHGHEKGDEVILFFVSLVNRIIRPSDVFVRYGGEEFLIIASGPNNIENVIALAKRISNQYALESGLLIPGKKLTCSAGIALWKPVEPYLSPKELIDCADRALYRAKENGRNRVEVWGE